jgi:hypothetical protein
MRRQRNAGRGARIGDQPEGPGPRIPLIFICVLYGGIAADCWRWPPDHTRRQAVRAVRVRISTAGAGGGLHLR